MIIFRKISVFCSSKEASFDLSFDDRLNDGKHAKCEFFLRQRNEHKNSASFGAQGREDGRKAIGPLKMHKRAREWRVELLGVTSS